MSAKDKISSQQRAQHNKLMKELNEKSSVKKKTSDKARGQKYASKGTTPPSSPGANGPEVFLNDGKSSMLSLGSAADDSSVNDMMQTLAAANTAVEIRKRRKGGSESQDNCNGEQSKDKRPKSMLDSFEPQTKKDKNYPDLMDVFTIKIGVTNTVVVADFANNSVKSFWKKDGEKCESTLQLDDWPWSLARVGDKGAASVPASKKIVMFYINPTLKLSSTMSTKKAYYGLVSLESQELAAGADGCVDILNMAGEVTKTISLAFPNSSFGDTPYYLARAINGNLMVSNHDTDTVRFATKTDGRQVPEKIRLINPRGVTVNPKTGDVFIAVSTAMKVVQFSKEGRFVRDVLTAKDGLQNPVGVHVYDESTVYVTDEGRVKVFNTSSVTWL